MIFWGFVLWFVGAVAGVMALLVSATEIIAALEQFGFAGYMGRLFDMQYLTAKKIVFVIALVMVIVGLVMFLVGRSMAKRGAHVQGNERALKYWRDLKGEYRKITWPTFKAVAKNTGVTLFVCALAAVFICVVDIGLSYLVDLLLKL